MINHKTLVILPTVKLMVWTLHCLHLQIWKPHGEERPSTRSTLSQKHPKNSSINWIWHKVNSVPQSREKTNILTIRNSLLVEMILKKHLCPILHHLPNSLCLSFRGKRWSGSRLLKLFISRNRARHQMLEDNSACQKCNWRRSPSHLYNLISTLHQLGLWRTIAKVINIWRHQT